MRFTTFAACVAATVGLLATFAGTAAAEQRSKWSGRAAANA
jgi:hypothetical protein